MMQQCSPSWTDPAASSFEKPVRLEYIPPTLYPSSPPASSPVSAFQISTEYSLTGVTSDGCSELLLDMIMAFTPPISPESPTFVFWCIARKDATMGG